MVNILHIADVQEKLQKVEEMVHQLLSDVIFTAPAGLPGRDIQVLPPHKHPHKKGFTLVEGRARFMHDLANIELQALELAIRTLVEFPHAPKLFREQLADVALSEARHLQACLKQLSVSGFNWGHWPIHAALWNSVSADDDLLDRIFIVHRYLEGSGLDAGDTLLRRLRGMSETNEQKVMQMIHDEEVGHVAFGSEWYRRICADLKLDPDHKMKEQIGRLRTVLPKRLDKISVETRKKAGFTENEIVMLDNLRLSFLEQSKGPGPLHPVQHSATDRAEEIPVLN
ncbi:MAG: DUF455 family protein [Bdellovibrionota bacterium]